MSQLTRRQEAKEIFYLVPLVFRLQIVSLLIVLGLAGNPALADILILFLLIKTLVTLVSLLLGTTLVPFLPNSDHRLTPLGNDLPLVLVPR